MNKIIIIFGVLLVLLAGWMFYQFKAPVKTITVAKKEVIIAGKTFHAEVVSDQKSQEIGLTKYTLLKPNEGMLFLFPTADYHPFWMRGMHFSLDIIFINGDAVTGIFENLPIVKADAPTESIQTYGGSLHATKVLELPSGTVKKNAIKKGDTVIVKL